MKLEDVAARAGVSTATVSRVLNNLSVVKASTRTRVLRAAEELKYYPNINAQALAGGKSRTLGLVVSNIENPFFLDIYRSLEAEAHSKGYEVIVANTGYDPERLKASVRIMLGRRPAGLAIVVSEMDNSLLDELEERKVRTVVYDVGRPRRNMTSIKTNYKKGMQRVAEYLYSLGHRHMAFIGHHTTLGPLNDRRETFLEVMKGYAPNVEFTTLADADGFAGGRRAAREVFTGGLRPTAILCANDFMAVGVLRQLREMGMAVPRDISVTGFDNIELSEEVAPSLTTVHIGREQIGRHIFENLSHEGAENRKTAREIVIEPELMVRESTGAAPLNRGRTPGS